MVRADNKQVVAVAAVLLAHTSLDTTEAQAVAMLVVRALSQLVASRGVPTAEEVVRQYADVGAKVDRITLVFTDGVEVTLQC